MSAHGKVDVYGREEHCLKFLRFHLFILRNVNARVFTDGGQRPILKPHLSNQCSISRKTSQHPWRPYIYKTNLFTKFHDDWANNVSSRVKLPPGSHVIQLTGTIFKLNSCINETNVLTKFHETGPKIEKNAPPTGGHVFSPIWTIFEPKYQ
ncbi:hypothetical protein DPMN_008746 [Dreissena polymorpha]|uniref:Uncharacterized protein n=1 Tax=Dreissena polymorpha TaxID=45954 RepID=A0A9D4RZG1_DREPO|nr:hypothetical protein DPMN_008746 [Dreissena polymorpha]